MSSAPFPSSSNASSFDENPPGSNHLHLNDHDERPPRANPVRKIRFRWCRLPGRAASGAIYTTSGLLLVVADPTKKDPLENAYRMLTAWGPHVAQLFAHIHGL